MIEVIKFDKFDIFCPFYTNEEESLNGEQYLIWQVSQSVWFSITETLWSEVNSTKKYIWFEYRNLVMF